MRVRRSEYGMEESKDVSEKMSDGEWRKEREGKECERV